MNEKWSLNTNGIDPATNRFRVDAPGIGHAVYGVDGARMSQSTGMYQLSAEQLAAWDREAINRAPGFAAEYDATQQRIAHNAYLRNLRHTLHAVPATWNGTCRVTGRSYRRGDWVYKPAEGWSIADEQTLDRLGKLDRVRELVATL